jgi:hypothetical protein
MKTNPDLEHWPKSVIKMFYFHFSENFASSEKSAWKAFPSLV